MSICCGTLPLKGGVISAIVLDLTVGVMSLMELAFTAWNAGDGTIHYVLFTCISDLLALTAIPFSILCLISLYNESFAHIHLYSVFKHFELFAVSLFSLVHFRIACVEGDLGCDLVTMSGIWIGKTALNLYLTKVVWSADVRLANGELVTVLYGGELMRQMQEEAIAASKSAKLTN